MPKPAQASRQSDNLPHTGRQTGRNRQELIHTHTHTQREGGRERERESESVCACEAVI